MARAGPLHGRERAAGRDERSPLGPRVDVLRGRLAVVGRVRHREDDRRGRVGLRRLHDLAAERAALPGEPQQDGDLAAPDGLEERRGPVALRPPGHAGGVVGDRLLVRLETGATGEHEAAGVDDVDARLGLIAAQAQVDQPLDHLLGDADTPGPGAVNEHHLLREGSLRPAGGGEQAGQRDGAGALDVVVERRQDVHEALQDRERLLLAEVLPLQERVREPALEGRHEALEEVVVGLALQPLVSHSEVERVVEQVGAVGADVELDGQGQGRVDAGSRRVER